MRLLLDTHALIWLLNGSPELSFCARTAIFDPQNEKWLSIASSWEITIKTSLGKLPQIGPLAEFFEELSSYAILRQFAIEASHLLQLAALSHYHRDPFDRLIVAQALSESCTLVSSDGRLDAYRVTRVW